MSALFASNYPVSGTYADGIRIPGSILPGTTSPAAFSTGNTNAIEISSKSCNVYGVNCLNPNTGDIVLRLYNLRADQVDPSKSIPRKTFIIPGTASVAGKQAGQVFVLGIDFPIHFGNGLSVRVSAAWGDTDTTNVTTTPVLELELSKPDPVLAPTIGTP
jgi:hypothetical protein